MLVLALLSAATPAAAVWGPTLGGQYLKPSQAGAKALTGWEAGLAAFGPEGQGFWHFAYGQARGDAGMILTTMAGRLNFSLVGRESLMIYAGPGFGYDSIKAGTKRKAWIGRVQAGILVCPVRTAQAKEDARPNPNAPPPGPHTAGALDIGLEGGWRFGPEGFAGGDARAYLLLTI